MSSLRLPHPIRPKDHTPLHTIDEARAYLNALPGQVATTPAWESAAGLGLKALENPTEAALDEFTSQFEQALFLTHRIEVLEGIARPSRSRASDRVEQRASASKGESTMRRLLSVCLAALSVAFGIWIISGHYGGGVQPFVERWCALIGVSDRASIQVATGIFAGAALMIIIYACCALLAQLLWVLFRARGGK
jgi:hypothetical protein